MSQELPDEPVTPNAPAQTWIRPVTLEGLLVRLEPLERRHAADLLAACDPSLFTHLLNAPPEWSLAGFEADVDRVCSYPHDVPFAIVLGSTGRAIGRTAFRDIAPLRRGLEIGRTWIGRAWHGTGVNTDIKLLMLQHAFEGLSPSAERVALWTTAENARSQRAIEKLGATREGVLRRYGIDAAHATPGVLPTPRDMVLYSIIAAEWPAVRARLESQLRAIRLPA